MSASSTSSPSNEPLTGADVEAEETDVLWDENGTARYRLLKDGRLVDFEGHYLAWMEADGNIYDYKGRFKGYYLNGILRDPEGLVLALGEDPIGPKPVLNNRGKIPEVVEPAGPEPKRPKPSSKAGKRPEPGLLWSKKMFEEI